MRSKLGSVLFAAGAGAVLTAVGVLAGGGGDGTDLFCWLFSSPLAILGFTGVLLGTPVLWGLAGWLGSNSQTIWARRTLAALLLIHYGSAIALGLNSSPGDWKALGVMARNPIGLSLGLVSIVLYLWLQIWLWVCISSRGRQAPC